MSDYTKYLNNLKTTLLAYNQMDDSYISMMKSSMELSSLYGEMMIRAMPHKGKDSYKEMVVMIDKAKRASELYDVMMARYEGANKSFIEVYSKFRGLVEYTERLEKEFEDYKESSDRM
jgi:hypothetical protein